MQLVMTCGALVMFAKKIKAKHNEETYSKLKISYLRKVKTLFFRTRVFPPSSSSSHHNHRRLIQRISEFPNQTNPNSQIHRLLTWIRKRKNRSRHHLALCHAPRHAAVSLVVNAAPVPASSPATIHLHRGRVDRHAAEVTYVATDTVSLSGSADFEVYENDALFLCGSLERLDSEWRNGSGSGWGMDCHVAAGPRLGVSAPSIEVYVAGCCSGVPVILNKTIQMSPRRRVPRHATLDAIPEDEEMMMMMMEKNRVNGFAPNRKLQITESEVDDYDCDEKMGNGFYSQEMYPVYKRTKGVWCGVCSFRGEELREREWMDLKRFEDELGDSSTCTIRVPRI
ncbi:uncharacterized protein HKW66_Vig0170710 [Vigna angularis]|uniref:Uncharacterized protein n=1 Tax=Phaseolus angularis TaxID=3914 RepID=A0A8T0JQ11_PHAAN|nr:uncharacterized protein HKW66_Vig0170710 [Vigna angularis]